MPELPPPPPPPLSLAGVLVDASRRWLGRAIGSSARLSVSDLEPDDALPAAPAVPLRLLIVGVALVVSLLTGGGWVVLQRVGGSSAPPEVALPRAAPRPAAAGAPAASAEAVTGAAAGAGDEPSGPVTVHAAGAVVQPGIYRLPPGARVADLVQAAGGAAGDAEVDALNLAAPLSDGQRVYVPRRGELAPGALLAAGSDALASGPGPPERPVDLNTATLEQLDALPGVGPTTAQAILDFRRTNGKFRSVDELLEVRGIGPSRLQTLRKKVRV